MIKVRCSACSRLVVELRSNDNPFHPSFHCVCGYGWLVWSSFGRMFLSVISLFIGIRNFSFILKKVDNESRED